MAHTKCVIKVTFCSHIITPIIYFTTILTLQYTMVKRNTRKSKELCYCSSESGTLPKVDEDFFQILPGVF